MKFLAAMLAALLLVPALPAIGGGDIEEIPACQYCGMDRDKFGQTRMLVEYENGSRIGVCSIHDAAVDLSQSISKTIKTIWVADYDTRKLIDAEQAAWVIGGDLPGVMSAKSRVAFADKAGASAFQKEHGGETVSFDDAIDDTFDEMWKDIKMIREKRAKMKSMKGM
jgi:nitrous oxide reductase accessory protein NosL